MWLLPSIRILQEGNYWIGSITCMKNLQWIQLGGCLNVTDHGVRKLQRLLPNTKVEKDDEEWSFHQIPR